MELNISQIDTSPENQTRPIMYDPKHVEAIMVSLKNEDQPENVLPPIMVEPMMGSTKYRVIDGHHRLEALRRLGRNKVNVVETKMTAHQKALEGLRANCTKTPQKIAGMGEVEVTLTKLYREGTNILDTNLQNEIADMLNHSNRASVSKVANRIANGKKTDPVDVVSQADIDNRYEERTDQVTAVNHTQSTKVTQGLGGLLTQMMEEDKPTGILLIYFKDGVEKKRYDYGRILKTVNAHDLAITVEYLN